MNDIRRMSIRNRAYFESARWDRYNEAAKQTAIMESVGASHSIVVDEETARLIALDPHGFALRVDEWKQELAMRDLEKRERARRKALREADNV